MEKVVFVGRKKRILVSNKQRTGAGLDVTDRLDFFSHKIYLFTSCINYM